MSSLPCPKCGGRSLVKDSRPCELNGGYPAVRRRLACNKCRYRWTTFETILSGARILQHLKRMKREARLAIQSMEKVIAQIDASDVGIDDSA